MQRLLIFLFVLPIAGYSQSSQPRPSEVIDVLNYKFRVELNDSTDRIEAVAEVTALATRGASEIQLDLIAKSAGKGMQVTDVKSKNSSLKFSHANHKSTNHFSQSICWWRATYFFNSLQWNSF
jgi:hypothetical protein